MRKDKESAVILRKNGRSYEQIRKKLGIPKSTLSDWFRNEKWSRKVFNKLNKSNIEISTRRIVRLDKIRGKKLEKLYGEARNEAKEDFDVLKQNSLFVSGVMIYWGEGDKVSKYGFRISNSDPLLIKIFLKFLRKVCGAEEKRIKAGLLIYPDLDKETCEDFWSNKIGLNRSNFNKSVTIQGKHKTRRVSHGICTLNFSSRFLKEKMLIWMSLLGQELLK